MRRFAAGFLLGIVCFAGCGGGNELDVVPVEGTVTLDGDPLPRAIMYFTPQGVAEGGPSYGVTDDNGHYSLQYTEDLDGAVPGTHKVRISTYAEAEEDEEGNVIPASPELVPAEYNTQSILTADVAADGGPFDFALESSGAIDQPAEESERDESEEEEYEE